MEEMKTRILKHIELSVKQINDLKKDQLVIVLSPSAALLIRDKIRRLVTICGEFESLLFIDKYPVFIEALPENQFSLMTRNEYEIYFKNKKEPIDQIEKRFFIHMPTGERGELISEYFPTGKPLTMKIKTKFKGEFFAPSHEFKEVF